MKEKNAINHVDLFLAEFDIDNQQDLLYFCKYIPTSSLYWISEVSEGRLNNWILLKAGIFFTFKTFSKRIHFSLKKIFPLAECQSITYSR